MTDTSQESAGQSKKGLWKPVLLILIIIGIMVTAHVTGAGSKLKELKDWIQNLGPAGYAVFVFLYIGTTVFALPGSVLTFMAGALFGTVTGSVLVSVASTAGAGICFIIARYIARKPIERSLSRNETFQKLDSLTEKQGPIIVAVTRLVPVFPFNLLNYGFGLTKVPFPVYLIVSWICMLPATIVYVGIGDAVSKGAQGTVDWKTLVTLSIVVLIMVAAVSMAKKKLHQTEEGKEMADDE